MEEKIIVLSVGKPWAIKDEKTDKISMEGCSMWYLPASDLTKTEDVDSGVIGVQPLKESMGVSFYEVVKKIGLPAVANVTYGMKNSGGKQVLYIKGLDFVNEDKK